MKLKWYGHASFRITASDGLTIITDPYTPETAGYKEFTETCNMVIMSSHNDPFHCRADLIPGSPTVVDALKLADDRGERTVHGIPIKAVNAMEALNHIEHDPDQNAMYRFEIDGISIGHMGDVGNALSVEQIAFFMGVDILLALAGGHPTIELDDLKTVIDEAKPRLVVPMHFRTLSYKPRNTFWIATFLEYFDDEQVDFACASEVEILKESLPETMRVLVVDHA